jgi:H-NS histone family
MATATRVYLVTIGEHDRLVRASHPSRALMHVAKDIAKVGVASQDELIECLSDGIKVETANESGDEPAAAPLTPVDDRTGDLFKAPAPVAPDPSKAAWPMPTPRTALVQAVDPAAAAADPDADDDEDDDDPQAVPSRAARPSPVKYRDPATGSSWTGKGLKPAWLREALNAGRTLAEFQL